jgi:hypothetical protein
MTVSLLAALMLIAQPAPQEAPEEQVSIEAEAQVQAQVAPVPAAEAEAVAEEEEAQAPQREEVCRRRLVPSERVGQRHRVVRICRPRDGSAPGNTRR